MRSNIPNFPLFTQKSYIKTIRPLAASSLHGLMSWSDYLIAIDSTNGYLLQIDPHNDNTKILNPHNCNDFIGTTGIAITAERFWILNNDEIYYCSLACLNTQKWELKHFLRLPYSCEGLAVQENTIYVSCQRSGRIYVYSAETAKEITYLYAPGVGKENITITGEEVWLCDSLEQTVYSLDRATGSLKYTILTPFANPTGLCFHGGVLYIAYAESEPYIRDNPNANPNHELQYRDRTFIHPLFFQLKDRYTLSNGYLVEMCYVEELAPLENVELTNLEWRIALPADTPRQKVQSIEAIGIPFEEEIRDGQRVAVFKFDTLTGEDRYIFGWKAILEMWSIKYQITPRECENLPAIPPDVAQRYLQDDDDLAMDAEIIRRAAVEAVGSETNILRKVYSIRNYVYDRLSYGIKPHIDTPDVALKRGIGSCGEYLGVLLALSRLNGIPCRTVGRYKCPAYPHQKGIPLEPDFNHVWMEFYLPGVGWLPMESNPDDITEGEGYPTRFFMGLAWYHAEVGKGISFENLTSNGAPVNKEFVSIGELAINHVHFTILEDLIPE